jgi:hypothetical protein
MFWVRQLWTRLSFELRYWWHVIRLGHMED